MILMLEDATKEEIEEHHKKEFEEGWTDEDGGWHEGEPPDDC